MLRRHSTQQVAWLECLQLIESGLQGRDVEFLFQCEVTAPGLELQALQLHERAQRQKEVVRLGPLGARGRTRQRSVLLQRLVVLLDLPPFLVEAHHAVTIKCRVARHQIQKALAVVLVRKDLLDQKQREADLLQIDFLRLAVFECQRSDCLKAPFFLVLLREGHVAVALEGHHEVFVQFGLEALVG